MQIIWIQETKWHKNKSTSYMDQNLPDYKIIHQLPDYNNSNNTTPHKHNLFLTYTPTKGGILAMIHKSIYSSENITKIPTPPTILPYLQVLKITNKSWNLYSSSTTYAHSPRRLTFLNGCKHGQVHNSTTMHIFSEGDSKLYTIFAFCEGKYHKHLKDTFIYKSKQFVLTICFSKKSLHIRRRCKECVSRYIEHVVV